MTNAEKLRAYMNKNGLTTKSAAEKSGVSESSIKRILAGKRSFAFTIDCLNDAFGLDLQYYDFTRANRSDITDSFLTELELLLIEGFINRDESTGDYIVVYDNIGQNLMRSILARILFTVLASKEKNVVSYAMACLTGAYRSQRVDRYAPILDYVKILFSSCTLSTYQDEVNICCKGIISDLSEIAIEQCNADGVLSNLRTAYKNQINDDILASLQEVTDWLCTHWLSINDLGAKSRIMSYLSIALDHATDNEQTRKMFFHAVLKSYYMTDLLRPPVQEAENDDKEAMFQPSTFKRDRETPHRITLLEALKMWWNGRN